MPEKKDLCSRTMTKKQIKQVGEKELNETEVSRNEGLKELRDWIGQQGSDYSCLNGVSDDFLMRFLRIKKMNGLKAARVLQRYVDIRTEKPEWFKMDIRDQQLNELITRGYIFVLPERDANGRRVVFFRASPLDPDKFHLNDVMRAFMLTYEALLVEEECQVNGISYIFDEEGTTWGHISMWTPSLASMAFGLAEGAIPISHKEVNLINLHWGMILVYQFAKSLLSLKLRDRICTLSLERLKEKVPEHILPKEYGGEVPLDDMVSEWKKVLEERRDQVMSLDSLKVPRECISKPLSSSKVTFDQADENESELKGR